MPPKHGGHGGGEHEGAHEGQRAHGGQKPGAEGFEHGGGNKTSDDVTVESWHKDQEAYRNANSPEERQKIKEKLEKDREALGYPTDDNGGGQRAGGQFGDGDLGRNNAQGLHGEGRGEGKHEGGHGGGHEGGHGGGHGGGHHNKD